MLKVRWATISLWVSPAAISLAAWDWRAYPAAFVLLVLHEMLVAGEVRNAGN